MVLEIFNIWYGGYDPPFCFAIISPAYQNKWEDYIDDMILAYPDLNYTTIGSEKCLALTAGLPFIKAKKNSIVTIPISFADSTDYHWFWIKKGSLFSTVAPQNDTTCIKADTIKNATWDDTLHGYKIRKGQIAKITIKLDDNDEFLFCKWSLDGNGYIVGGTYDVPQTIDYELIS